jgi:hypothetical protein
VIGDGAIVNIKSHMLTERTFDDAAFTQRAAAMTALGGLRAFLSLHNSICVNCHKLLNLCLVADCNRGTTRNINIQYKRKGWLLTSFSSIVLVLAHLTEVAGGCAGCSAFAVLPGRALLALHSALDVTVIPTCASEAV